MWPRLPRPDNRLYLGRGGSGKSSLVRHHASAYPRVVLFDPNGEDEAAAGAIVCERLSDLTGALLDAAPSSPVWICWRGVARDPEAFEAANRVLWAAGDLVAVWDEADQFIGSHRLPPEAYRLWNMGRHRGLRIWACSRRPQRISRDMTANLYRAAIFRMSEPRDLAFVSDFAGREAAEKVAVLPPYHALDWTEEGATVRAAPYA